MDVPASIAVSTTAAHRVELAWSSADLAVFVFLRVEVSSLIVPPKVVPGNRKKVVVAKFNAFCWLNENKRASKRSF